VENWIRILLIGFVILVPVYLISIRYASLNGQASVRSITAGQWAPLFWLAVVVMGMLIPAAAVIVSFGLGLEQTPSALLYFAILCGLAGDLSLRYLILRCGMYSPLIPAN
jgi:formate-dependent nitrite reductase membrane component NrfD